MITKREPLLSDKLIEHSVSTLPDNGYIRRIAKECFEDARSIYEAARAKDAELIQMLVNALEFERMSLVSCMESKKALDAAAAAGFKPSEQ